MTLAAPILDDRTFQELVDEAKKRIPHHCKEWTDHNVSDPGITLIELFAWMTELLLYRLNQVPQLHYIKFLEMLGIRLQEAIPARTPVTFWLSTPQPTVVVIPAHTEVASTQTETERSIIFSTDADLRIVPPKLSELFTRVSAGKSGDEAHKKTMREHNLRRLEAGVEGFDLFSSPPQVDDALYFGFENDLSQHLLGFDLDFDPAGGAGVDPTLPPYVWEASTGQSEKHWDSCEVEMDATKGMNTSGRIRIHLPKMGLYNVQQKTRYWVRVRIKEISAIEHKAGMRPYDVTPRLRKVIVASWGGAVPATHAQQITREYLGLSDGTPGQRFYLQFAPVLKRQASEHLQVQVEGAPPQPWSEVTDFADSGAVDRHYTLDSQSGEVRLGPAVRQQDGTIKLYGAIPPRGAILTFASYHYGGGQQGNVQSGILNTLKTSIPFVARVANRQPAWGGLDAETLDAAMARAPALLRSRQRAVTEEDFEFLARQALPAAIGRVKCLQPRPAEAGRVIPGQVYVLVIPRLPYPERFLEPKQLELKEEHVSLLYQYLENRRLLTTRLEIRPPAYYWISAKVKLRAAPGVEQAKVEAEALARLYRYLNPLTGGADGKGWPFGRDLFVSDIYQCLQGMPDVQFIRGVEMYAARPGGAAQGDLIESLEIVAHGVVASGVHSIEFV
ncbi:MAG: putative baseplate assembly protein [Anaerolineales bacterium]|nr:putative baseplate assembly protein [Anaerolineales bacterium]